MPADSKTFRDRASGSDQFSVLDFFFRQSMAKVRIATLVMVKSVTNNGELAAVGYVDVQPMVHQTDGQGNIVTMPQLHHLPYLRVQGGTNAVILDPKVGDIGIAIFCDRDISSVIASKSPSAPGSNRRNSLSDGLYIGGVLNGVPQQYVRFSDSGVEVVSPTQVKITAPDIQLNGPVHVTGAQTNDSTITASGEVKSGSIGLQEHHHTAQGATSPTTAAQP